MSRVMHLEKNAYRVTCGKQFCGKTCNHFLATTSEPEKVTCKRCLAKMVKMGLVEEN
jgi:uncharacterized ferredoxin-like protein